MKYGEICTGIGGLSIALERLGFEPAWFVENNPFCLKVLKKHWPSVPRYGDLKQLTSSLGDSPASPSPLRGTVEERMTLATSGPRSSPLFAIYDPASSSWRTCQVSLLTNTLAPYSKSWPKQGTMRNGVCFQRRRLGHGTRGKGSSFLPTPSAHESKGSQRNRYRDSPDYRGAKMSEGLRTCSTDPIYLNPSFGELAMGLPKDWTVLETPSSPPPPCSPSPLYGTE